MRRRAYHCWPCSPPMKMGKSMSGPSADAQPGQPAAAAGPGQPAAAGDSDGGVLLDSLSFLDLLYAVPVADLAMRVSGSIPGPVSGATRRPP